MTSPLADLAIFPQLFDYVLCSTDAIIDICKQANADEQAILSTLILHSLPGSSALISLMKALVSMEFENASSGGSILRQNSMATKLISKYLKDVGSDYLPDQTQDEVDEQIEKAKLNTERYLDAYLNSITSQESIDALPYSICFISNFVLTLSQQHSDSLSSPTALVGGLLFLRFICPSLFGSDMINASMPFIPESQENCQISRNTQKNLLVITKVLQSLSNGVELGLKEEKMKVMNDYVQRNQARMNDFLLAVCERGKTAPPPSKTAPTFWEKLRDTPDTVRFISDLCQLWQIIEHQKDMLLERWNERIAEMESDIEEYDPDDEEFFEEFERWRIRKTLVSEISKPFFLANDTISHQFPRHIEQLLKARFSIDLSDCNLPSLRTIVNMARSSTTQSQPSEKVNPLAHSSNTAKISLFQTSMNPLPDPAPNTVASPSNSSNKWGTKYLTKSQVNLHLSTKVLSLIPNSELATLQSTRFITPLSSTKDSLDIHITPHDFLTLSPCPSTKSISLFVISFFLAYSQSAKQTINVFIDSTGNSAPFSVESCLTPVSQNLVRLGLSTAFAISFWYKMKQTSDPSEQNSPTSGPSNQPTDDQMIDEVSDREKGGDEEEMEKKKNKEELEDEKRRRKEEEKEEKRKRKEEEEEKKRKKEEEKEEKRKRKEEEECERKKRKEEEDEKKRKKEKEKEERKRKKEEEERKKQLEEQSKSKKSNDINDLQVMLRREIKETLRIRNEEKQKQEEGGLLSQDEKTKENDKTHEESDQKEENEPKKVEKEEEKKEETKKEAKNDEDKKEEKEEEENEEEKKDEVKDDEAKEEAKQEKNNEEEKKEEEHKIDNGPTKHEQPKEPATATVKSEHVKRPEDKGEITPSKLTHTLSANFSVSSEHEDTPQNTPPPHSSSNPPGNSLRQLPFLKHSLSHQTLGCGPIGLAPGSTPPAATASELTQLPTNFQGDLTIPVDLPSIFESDNLSDDLATTPSSVNTLLSTSSLPQGPSYFPSRAHMTLPSVKFTPQTHQNRTLKIVRRSYSVSSAEDIEIPYSPLDKASPLSRKVTRLTNEKSYEPPLPDIVNTFGTMTFVGPSSYSAMFSLFLSSLFPSIHFQFSRQLVSTKQQTRIAEKGRPTIDTSTIYSILTDSTYVIAQPVRPFLTQAASPSNSSLLRAPVNAQCSPGLSQLPTESKPNLGSLTPRPTHRPTLVGDDAISPFSAARTSTSFSSTQVLLSPMGVASNQTPFTSTAIACQRYLPNGQLSSKSCILLEAHGLIFVEEKRIQEFIPFHLIDKIIAKAVENQLTVSLILNKTEKDVVFGTSVFHHNFATRVGDMPLRMAMREYYDPALPSPTFVLSPAPKSSLLSMPFAQLKPPQAIPKFLMKSAKPVVGSGSPVLLSSDHLSPRTQRQRASTLAGTDAPSTTFGQGMSSSSALITDRRVRLQFHSEEEKQFFVVHLIRERFRVENERTLREKLKDPKNKEPLPELRPIAREIHLIQFPSGFQVERMSPFCSIPFSHIVVRLLDSSLLLVESDEKWTEIQLVLIDSLDVRKVVFSLEKGEEDIQNKEQPTDTTQNSDGEKPEVPQTEPTTTEPATTESNPDSTETDKRADSNSSEKVDEIKEINEILSDSSPTGTNKDQPERPLSTTGSAKRYDPKIQQEKPAQIELSVLELKLRGHQILRFFIEDEFVRVLYSSYPSTPVPGQPSVTPSPTLPHSPPTPNTASTPGVDRHPNNPVACILSTPLTAQHCASLHVTTTPSDVIDILSFHILDFYKQLYAQYVRLSEITHHTSYTPEMRQDILASFTSIFSCEISSSFAQFESS
ncbi:hypothetical protein BLNAU_6552 [Blattamonas nauphoetae]|uniref:Ras-GAP domain-containing protein n=1 Tax=Blattamonas nauphoetae TaxID=2049346 RepID=A0ABQ9Y443_9EUKA|nr:hypothetical protein BLNAU_6552 [Blattamonas nauphoetae]